MKLTALGLFVCILIVYFSSLGSSQVPSLGLVLEPTGVRSEGFVPAPRSRQGRLESSEAAVFNKNDKTGRGVKTDYNSAVHRLETYNLRNFLRGTVKKTALDLRVSSLYICDAGYSLSEPAIYTLEHHKHAGQTHRVLARDAQEQKAMHTFYASNATELQEALQNASAGDVVELAAGDYGRLYNNGSWAKYSGMVTIRSADSEDPAVFGEIEFRGVENITLEGLNFAASSEYKGALSFSHGSSNVVVKECDFRGGAVDDPGSVHHGYPEGTAVNFRDTNNITFESNTIEHYHIGMSVRDVDNAQIVNNEISEIRMDFTRFVAAKNILIEGNHLHDSNASPDSTEHRDMIQFFSYGTDSASENVVIRGNFLNNGNGDWTQSIFVRNEAVDSQGAGPDMMYRNFVIEDNVIHNSHVNGIWLSDVEGLAVRKNTLINNSTGNWAPTIQIKGGSNHIEVSNNIAPGVTIAGTVGADTVVQNNITGFHGSFEDEIFVNPFSGGYATLEDLQVRPGSIAEGHGSSLSVYDSTPDELVLNIDGVVSRVFEHEVIELTTDWSRDENGLLSDSNYTFGWQVIDKNGQVVMMDQGSTLQVGGLTAGSYEVQLFAEGSGGEVSTKSVGLEVEPSTLLSLDLDGGVAVDESTYGVDFEINDPTAIQEVDGFNVLALRDGVSLSVVRPPSHLNHTISHLFELETFTIDIGLRLDDASSPSGYLFGVHNSFSISLDDDGRVAFSDGNGRLVSETPQITNTAWHNIAVSYDSVAGMASIYVDGNTVAQGAIENPTKGMEYWAPSLGSPWGDNVDAQIIRLNILAEAAKGIGFDESFYLSRYPDVASAVTSGLIQSASFHYDEYGWREGRDPNADFDTSYYLENNLDVAAVGINPLFHYGNYGYLEGRQRSESFTPYSDKLSASPLALDSVGETTTQDGDY